MDRKFDSLVRLIILGFTTFLFFGCASEQSITHSPSPPPSTSYTSSASSTSTGPVFSTSTPTLSTISFSTPKPVGSASPTKDSNLPFVFTSNINSVLSINTINFDGADSVQLTDSTSNNFKPKWSPDGTMIAFLSDREDPLGQLFVMSADGSDVALVADISAVNSYDWSPDSQILVFSSREPNLERNYIIYQVSLDDLTVFPLFHSREFVAQLRWSPMGNQILVKSGNIPSRDAILIIDLYGGFLHIRKSFTRGMGTVEWHPGGAKIVYDGVYDWGNDKDLIHSINSDNTDDIPLTGASHSSAYPKWSPMGDKLAYVCYFENESPGICLLDLISNKTTRVSPRGGSAISPRWSGDGRSIAYLIENNEIQNLDHALYVFDLDTGKTKVIVDSYVHDFDW